MSVGSGRMWEILGIEETGDQREIRRAYSRGLQERSPEEDPAAFSELRAAYAAALRYAILSVTSRPAGNLAGLPDPARALRPPQPPPSALGEAAAKRVALFRRTLEAGGDPTETALGRILDEDPGAAKPKEVELELIRWLVAQERPARVAIEVLDRRFGWAEADSLAEDEPSAAVRYLLARRGGYEEMDTLAELGRQHPGSLYRAVVDPPAGPAERQKMARRLRRRGVDRGQLWDLAARFPLAFDFEISRQLADWLASELPQPSPPSFFDPELRFYDAEVPRGWGLWRYAYAGLFRGQAEVVAAWPTWRYAYGAIFCLAASAALVPLVSRQPSFESASPYFLLSFFLLPLADSALSAMARWTGDSDLGWVQAAALWTVLALAILAQVCFRLTTYPLWWGATMLAIGLGLQEARPLRRIVMELFGYLVAAIFLVGKVQGELESPFGYFFFIPLLLMRGCFFAGWLRLGRGRSALVLTVPFLAATLAASLAPVGGDLRRVLLGLALILLFLVLRAMEYGLADLILLPLLVQIAAFFLKASFDLQPWLLLLYLPLVFATPFGRARLREALGQAPS